MAATPQPELSPVITKQKLTVGAEVVYQDYFLNQGWRTSHQDTEREKKRDGDQET